MPDCLFIGKVDRKWQGVQSDRPRWCPSGSTTGPGRAGRAAAWARGWNACSTARGGTGRRKRSSVVTRLEAGAGRIGLGTQLLEQLPKRAQSQLTTWGLTTVAAVRA